MFLTIDRKLLVSHFFPNLCLKVPHKNYIFIILAYKSHISCYLAASNGLKPVNQCYHLMVVTIVNGCC